METTKIYPYSILYVEDEPSVRQNYTYFLEDRFETVYSVGSAEEAKTIFEENDIDILLMDISLPGQNGLDFVENVRKENQTVRVIVLTAHSDQQWLLQATQLKLTTYLLKPIERTKLRDALQMAVNELEQYEVISKKVIALENGLQWDTQERSFINTSIHLTTNETLFLAYLFENRRSVASSDEICYEIWNESVETKGAALKTLVKKLRKKLPDQTIENIYAQGYRVRI